METITIEELQNESNNPISEAKAQKLAQLLNPDNTWRIGKVLFKVLAVFMDAKGELLVCVEAVPEYAERGGHTMSKTARTGIRRAEELTLSSIRGMGPISQGCGQNEILKHHPTHQIVLTTQP